MNKSNEISYSMNGALVQLVASSPSVISPSIYPLNYRNPNEKYCENKCKNYDKYTLCMRNCLKINGN